MKDLRELIGNGNKVTDEELEFIEEHEDVEYCEYRGRADWDYPNYYWDVKLIDDDEIYTITQDIEED